MTSLDTGIQVLLLDDEPAIVAALHRNLRAQWPSAPPLLSVHGFTEPHAALGHLLMHSVDVIVCDYRMPAMDGVEFLRRARALQPHAGRVLLTGSPDLDAVLRAVNEAAAAQVMLKPWPPGELVQVVWRCQAEAMQRRADAARADAWRVAQGELDAQEAQRRLSSLPEVIAVEPSSHAAISENAP
jgi:response regulator RpfG family c-di-GMP phosphodiesterase